MEYPCPSLDNIPLPDGAQPVRLRDRKKPTVCPPVVSPGTSTPAHISTDGQLTTFNMADVPLPSSKYNDTKTRTTLSIPLPEGNNSSSSTSSSSSASSSSSKTLVDKLFEDFLSQKIKQPEQSTKVQSTSKPAFTNSVEEIKRFLDKEINQLSCKAGASGVGADGTDGKDQIAAEKEGVHEENTGPENTASTHVNQRTTVTLPLKIKISDSSVARISSGHLGPSSSNQSETDELIGKIVPVAKEESQLTGIAVCSEKSPPPPSSSTSSPPPPPSLPPPLPENERESKADSIAPEADLESNGVAEVEITKSSKSSKKHKHKKKKSHKHSRDKNKSTAKLRLHSKKHKSVTKSHSKAKHKSSNGTKSPKKTSKTSHSKSKSSKKSKKTKTKNESKSKQLAESATAESKSSKKSKTRSTSPENQLPGNAIFAKASALGQIVDENLALKSPKKEEKLPIPNLSSDRKFRSRSRSKSPECSPVRKITDTKCHPEDNVQKALSSSPFQAKTLPLKIFSSPSPANLTSHTPVSTSVALVTPVTTSSVLQAVTVSPITHMAPPFQSQPHPTSSAELPAVSHSLEPVTQSASVPLSTVPTTTCSQPDLIMQTSPVVSQALVSPLLSKQSPPLSLSSPLNLSSVLPQVKSSLPVQELGGIVSHVTAPLETPPLGLLTKSQEKDTLPNCSQPSLQVGMLVPITSVSADIAKNSCMPSAIELSEQANKIGSSLKPLNKNSTVGQSGLLGLAAYFKSKTQSSPSPESSKDGKLAKSSSKKKTKGSSDSSDESPAQKRSRSTTRKSSHSRSLSRSGIGKHSSSDKRKKTRSRSRRSRSSSRSRSHSRSWSKSRRRPTMKSTKKRSRSRSRSRSEERGRQSSFRSSKRRFSRSPSRSRNKTYRKSGSRSRSRGRNRVIGHGASRSRSPSKRATYRRTRSRSRSYSRGRYRHRVSSRSHKSKSRSRSRSRSNIRSRDKRSRSRSNGRHRDYRQSNNKSRRFSRRHSSQRSRSSSASSSCSRRRRSRSKSGNSLGIDKVKLHDIAVKKLLESGQAPKEEVASLRAGGKTVQGLIDYCKRISQKELESDSGDSTHAAMKSDDDDEESPFIHHPFRLRESQPNIVLNIKNAKPLPVLTPQEKLIQSSTLRLQFPVSSGSQHRAKESQWVPVQKNSTSATLFTVEESASSSSSTSSSSGSNLQNTAPPAPAVAAVATAAAVAATTADAAAYTADGGMPSETSGSISKTMVTGTNFVAPGLQSQTTENKSNVDNVFPDIPQQTVDISQVMTERMLAVQKLQENPNDVQALNLMYKAQQEVNRWAQSKQLPGQFTGSTGAKVMTQEELNGPDKRFQAWAKKEQLQNAAPVRGGIGMHLLQKMGWRQGEGLGKHNEGPTEPILVNVKVDRKGLTSHGEDPKKSLAVEVAGKHPVSALVELCSKCKWGTPMFQQVEEKGPDHKKSFMFKVTVNNITYQPTMASNSKKNGRARAAILCLQDLGLLPKNII